MLCQQAGHRQHSSNKPECKSAFLPMVLLFIEQIHTRWHKQCTAMSCTDHSVLQRWVPSGRYLQVGGTAWRRGGAVSSPVGRGMLPGAPPEWQGGCALQCTSQPPCEAPAAPDQTRPCAIACSAWLNDNSLASMTKTITLRHR